MSSKANIPPNSQASFGAFYFSGPGQAQERKSGEVLDNIVINCNTKDELLSQNRWKLNRQLKQALVVSGVIEKETVKKCLTTSSFPEIEIHLPKGKSKSLLKNIHTCKNFWKCPVCRGNALHKKREEIHEVVKRSGTQNIMATFTIRHDRRDGLLELMKGLQSASSDLWRDRVWKGLKKKYLFEWQVRNLEVTWGKENGWHAHIHTLIGSLSDAIDIAHIEGELFRAWDRLVQKYGLQPLDRQAGVNVVPADSADSYIVKWVIGKEMAGYKSGRKGNVSMGDLELDILQYSLSPRHEGYVSESQTRALLKEYHKAFDKRKFMQPGGKYNEILGKSKASTEAEEIEEKKDEGEKDIVYVKTTFWSKLYYSGYAFDFLSVLEERGVVEGIDWLERRVKNPQSILKNIRVERVEKLEPASEGRESGILCEARTWDERIRSAA